MAIIKYKEAALLEVRKGNPLIGEKPSKSDLKNLYLKKSRSIREVAKILGYSKDMIYRSLIEYEIKRRNHSEKKSRLQDYELSYLKREVRRRGQVQVAEEIGVNQSILSRYKKRKNKQG